MPKSKNPFPREFQCVMINHDYRGAVRSTSNYTARYLNGWYRLYYEGTWNDYGSGYRYSDIERFIRQGRLVMGSIECIEDNDAPVGCELVL